jgi:hypothetical protein
MKNLPIGIQSFEGLRRDEYIYVDKTEYVYDLGSRKGVFFLSRPRRFGKSLFLSTLEAAFKGKKELFKGLWIEDRWDWSITYPVIRIDWTLISYSTPEVMKCRLCHYFQRIAKEYGISLSGGTPEDCFSELISSLYDATKQKVVILIDEYDKPITDNLFEPDFQKVRKGVHDLYQVMKGSDENIRFIFITGVSKFSGLSVFSALNNPQDISLNPKYTTICGYTQAELENYFAEYIDNAAANYNCSHDRMIEAIAHWYNGYSWSNGKSSVYNPHSTMSFFSEGILREAWFRTASPSFLLNILERRKKTTQLLENIDISSVVLEGGYDPETLEEIPLFFQTGYLTIKKMVTSLDRGTKYTLGIPNYEVRQALMLRLLLIYGRYEENTISDLRDRFSDAILDCNEQALETTLETIIAKAAPNQLKLNTEANYHALLLIWLNLAGFEVHSEVSNNYGRADAIWKHNGLTVVAELKYSAEASCETLLDEAMTQIHERQYYNQYFGKILLLGIAFSTVPDAPTNSAPESANSTVDAVSKPHIDIRCRMEVINR